MNNIIWHNYNMSSKQFHKSIISKRLHNPERAEEITIKPVNSILKDNKWLIISVCGLAVLIYVFFTVAHPIFPYDADDWAFLGIFRSPLPDMDRWNPSRILPEVSIPLAGHFAAYFVYPLHGDYLSSISIAIAIILCIFTVILFLSFYRLFLVLSGERSSSILSAFFVLGLYFVLFKTQPTGNQFFLGAHNKNTYFYYVIPNVLNSILVCTLMRYSVLGVRISMNGLGKGTFIGLAIALYFAIFSMLFSILALAVYCFYEIILNIIRREKFDKILPLVIIVAVILTYAGLEASGERALSGTGGTTNYSVFSLEFLEQALEGFLVFAEFLEEINFLVLFIALGGILAAFALLIINRKKDMKSPMVRIGLICLLCFVSLLPALLAISGRTAAWYMSLVQPTYCFFFYFMLFAGLCMLYITTKIKSSALFLTFFLVIFFLEAANSNKPFTSLSNYDQFYFGHTLNTPKKIELVNGWIEEIKAADRAGVESVTLRVPESDTPIWPLHYEWTGESICDTLRAHNIITRRFDVILMPDRRLTEELW